MPATLVLSIKVPQNEINGIRDKDHHRHVRIHMMVVPGTVVVVVGLGEDVVCSRFAVKLFVFVVVIVQQHESC